jgi:exosome complex exonuclease DIS3/RRP44
MIDNPNDRTIITQGIRNLNFIAKTLKKQRVEAGALSLASNQVKFSFDEETHNPSDVRMYSFHETNSLVEEFMLLANVSVAERILARFPSISVLRRHSEPKPK